MTRARGLVIAVDQGTSASKAVAIGDDGVTRARARAGVASCSPRPGWVEQNPIAILDSVERVLRQVVDTTEIPVVAVGLSTQRESAMAWDTASGEPLSKLLGWQDRRTSVAAARFDVGEMDLIRRVSGLPLDPMFSALKFAWILDAIDPDRALARSGRITLGTVDAWLTFRLTGRRRIERGNASRTQLVDVRSGEWSPLLLELFDVPAAGLPDIVASDDSSAIVRAGGSDLGTLSGVLGDSHAALFGHGCRRPGAVKATYGSGSSVMGLAAAADPPGGVAETIAWDVNGSMANAFEGNILSSGSTIGWLADLLATDPESLAALGRASGDGGIDLVPAFAGLAAPWWDPNAVGIISGLTLGAGRSQLARAALESVVLQVEDVLRAADPIAGPAGIREFHVDGGPSADDWLMQRQADLSGRTVIRLEDSARSALGVAWLAGAARGIWDHATPPWNERVTRFVPGGDTEASRARVQRWHEAVARARIQPAGPSPDATDRRERTPSQ